MNFTVRRSFHVQRVGQRSTRETGVAPVPTMSRVPRITRLMALAIRFEHLIASGVVTDYATLARLGQVTRARITQIMNLRLLSPRIQEAILFLPDCVRGTDPVRLGELQSIALTPLWTEQERLWRQLVHEVK